MNDPVFEIEPFTGAGTTLYRLRMTWNGATYKFRRQTLTKAPLHAEVRRVKAGFRRNGFVLDNWNRETPTTEGA